MQAWDRVASAVVVCLSLCACAGETHSSEHSFPPDFMFGVASAAYQIEGGWDASDKGESMWDRLTHQRPNFTVDGGNGDVAADSYHQWRRDIQMVKELGVPYYRISLSWPRILPNGTDNYISAAGVGFYRSLLQALLDNGISPMVTLYHWDLPQPLMDLGGWANPLMVDYFVDFARVAFTLFGDQVKYWITINEPQVHCVMGYGKGVFAPGLMAHGIGEYLCSHNQLLAHGWVYRLYDREFRHKQNGSIGITLDSFWAEPRDLNNPLDVAASERYMEMHLGLYAHPIYSRGGDYPEAVRQRIDAMSLHQGYSRSRLPRFTPQEVELLRGSSDFFGLNHYTSYLVSFCSHQDDWSVPSQEHDTGVFMEQHPGWPKTGAEWLRIYPAGFRKLLNWIKRQYGDVPILVTENGVADLGGTRDFQRVEYFNLYLEQMLLAIHEDGCRMIGYIAWALMDDFEWSDGYVTKFGLYHVDFASAEKTRTPKLSAFNYREIIRTGKINFDYIVRPSDDRNQSDVGHRNEVVLDV